MLTPGDQDQRRQVSVQQAEARYHAEVLELLAMTAGGPHRLDDHPRADVLRRPFGFQNERWEALKAQMRPGDELWEFCSDPASWDSLMGRAGYELRRDGIVVATIVSRLN